MSDDLSRCACVRACVCVPTHMHMSVCTLYVCMSTHEHPHVLWSEDRADFRVL